MADHGIIIDVGFQPDISGFISEIQQQFKKIDFDNIIGLSDSFKKQKSDVERQLKDLSSKIDEAINGKIGADPLKQISELQKAVSELKTGFGELVKVVPKDQLSSLSGDFSEITKTASNMSKVLNETVGAIDSVKKTSKNVSISPLNTNTLNDLKEAYRITSNILKLEEQLYTPARKPRNKLYDAFDEKEIVEKIKSLQSELNNALRSVKDNGGLKLIDGENIKELDKYRYKAASILTEISRHLQTLSDLNLSPKVSASKSFDEYKLYIEKTFNQIYEISQQRTEKIKDEFLSAGGLTYELEQIFEKSTDKRRSARIPVKLETKAISNIEEQLQTVIDTVNGKYAEEHPIELYVKLVSSVHSKTVNETLSKIKNELKNVGNKEVSKELQELIDKANSQGIDNAFLINVNVAADRATQQIKDFVAKAKQELGENFKISPELILTKEQIAKYQEQLDNAGFKIDLGEFSKGIQELKQILTSDDSTIMANFTGILDTTNKIKDLFDEIINGKIRFKSPIIEEGLVDSLELSDEDKDRIKEKINEISFLIKDMLSVDEIDNWSDHFIEKLQEVFDEIQKLIGGKNNTLVDQIEDYVFADRIMARKNPGGVFERAGVIDKSGKLHGFGTYDKIDETRYFSEILNAVQQSGLTPSIGVHSHGKDFLSELSLPYTKTLQSDLKASVLALKEGIEKQLVVGLKDVTVFDVKGFVESNPNIDFADEEILKLIYAKQKEISSEISKNLKSYTESFIANYGKESLSNRNLKIFANRQQVSRIFEEALAGKEYNNNIGNFLKTMSFDEFRDRNPLGFNESILDSMFSTSNLSKVSSILGEIETKINSIKQVNKSGKFNNMFNLNIDVEQVNILTEQIQTLIELLQQLPELFSNAFSNIQISAVSSDFQNVNKDVQEEIRTTAEIKKTSSTASMMSEKEEEKAAEHIFELYKQIKDIKNIQFDDTIYDSPFKAKGRSNQEHLEDINERYKALELTKAGVISQSKTNKAQLRDLAEEIYKYAGLKYSLKTRDNLQNFKGIIQGDLSAKNTEILLKYYQEVASNAAKIREAAKAAQVENETKEEAKSRPRTKAEKLQQEIDTAKEEVEASKAMIELDKARIDELENFKDVHDKELAENKNLRRAVNSAYKNIKADEKGEKKNIRTNNRTIKKAEAVQNGEEIKSRKPRKKYDFHSDEEAMERERARRAEEDARRKKEAEEKGEKYKAPNRKAEVKDVSQRAKEQKEEIKRLDLETKLRNEKLIAEYNKAVMKYRESGGPRDYPLASISDEKQIIEESVASKEKEASAAKVVNQEKEKELNTTKEITKEEEKTINYNQMRTKTLKAKLKDIKGKYEKTSEGSPKNQKYQEQINQIQEVLDKRKEKREERRARRLEEEKNAANEATKSEEKLADAVQETEKAEEAAEKKTTSRKKATKKQNDDLNKQAEKVGLGPLPDLKNVQATQLDDINKKAENVGLGTLPDFTKKQEILNKEVQNTNEYFNKTKKELQEIINKETAHLETLKKNTKEYRETKKIISEVNAELERRAAKRASKSTGKSNTKTTNTNNELLDSIRKQYADLSLTKTGKISEAITNKDKLSALASSLFDYSKQIGKEGQKLNLNKILKTKLSEKNAEILAKYYQSVVENAKKIDASTKESSKLKATKKATKQPVVKKEEETQKEVELNKKAYDQYLSVQEKYYSLKAKSDSGDQSAIVQQKLVESAKELERLQEDINKLEKAGLTDKEKQLQIDQRRVAYEETIKQKIQERQESSDLKSLDSATAQLNSQVYRAEDILRSDNYTNNNNFLIRLREILNEVKNVDQKDINKINELSEALKNLINEEAKNASVGLLTKYKNLRGNITDYIKKNGNIDSSFKQQFGALLTELDNGIEGTTERSIPNVNRLIQTFADLKTEINLAGQGGKTFLQQIGGRILDANSRIIARYLSIYSLVRYTRQIFTTIRELDTALVDLRKTTTMSAMDMEEFYHESNKVAIQMGVTTKEIIQQAADWSRLGYSTKEAATQMAELSSQFASISPGMDTKTATDGLVSAMKAFHVEVENVESDIMDPINKLGNTMATTNEEIVQMLERSSAAMYEANNSINETLALESAAVQITRNAETTGTAFRTIAMRIRGLDEETEEVSEEFENISGVIANLTKTAKTPGGISLFSDKDKTTYKSTYQLLKDISEVYDDLTDKEQARLIEKLAGKRGGQVLAGILGNFGEVEKAMTSLNNAAGSSDKEMEIIRDSIDYKINELKESWVGFLQEALTRNDVKDLFDSLIKGSESLQTALEKITPVLSGFINLLSSIIDVTSKIDSSTGGLLSYAAIVASITKILDIKNMSKGQGILGGIFGKLFGDKDTEQPILEADTIAGTKIEESSTIASTNLVNASTEVKSNIVSASTDASAALSTGAQEMKTAMLEGANEASTILKTGEVESAATLDGAATNASVKMVSASAEAGSEISGSGAIAKEEIADGGRTAGTELVVSSETAKNNLIVGATGGNTSTKNTQNTSKVPIGNLAITAVIAGIAGTIYAATKLSKVNEELASNLTKTYSEFNNNIESIDKYKERITELRQIINDNNLSLEEQQSARSEILSIQNEMIDKFGKEAASVDGLTQSFVGLNDALDKIKEKEYQEWLNNFNDENNGIWFKIKQNLDWTSDLTRPNEILYDRAFNYNTLKNNGSSGLFLEGGRSVTSQYRKELYQELIDVGREIIGRELNVVKNPTNDNYNIIGENVFDVYDSLIEMQIRYRDLLNDNPENEEYKEKLNLISKEVENTNELIKAREALESMYEHDVISREYKDEVEQIASAREQLLKALSEQDNETIEQKTKEINDLINSIVESSGNDLNVERWLNDFIQDIQLYLDEHEFEIQLKIKDGELEGIVNEIKRQIAAAPDEKGVINQEDLVSIASNDKATFSDISKTYGTEVAEIINNIRTLAKQNNVPISFVVEKLDVPTYAVKKLKEKLGKNVNLFSEDDIKILSEMDGVMTMGLRDMQNALEDYKKELNKPMSKSGMIDLLNGMSEGFDKLDEIYADIYDKKGFDFAKLDTKKFKESFEDLGIDYEDFIETVAGHTDDLDYCQEAFNKLVDSYIRSSGVLDNVTAETAQLTQSMLEMYGVSNAEIVVQEALQATEAQSIVNKYDLKNATSVAIQGLLEEISASDGVRASLIAAQAAEVLFANQSLNASQKVAALTQIAEAAWGAAAALEMQNALAENPSWMGDQNASLDVRSAKAWNHIKDKYNKMAQTTITMPEYTGGEKTKDAIDKANKSGSESREILDWIEVALKRVQESVTRLGKLVSATYRNWSIRNNAIISEVAEVRKEIELQTAAYQAYLTEAEKIPLAENYKKLVREGGMFSEEINDKDLKKRIDEYKDLYEKAIQAKDAVEDLYAQIAQLARQKFDNIASEFEGKLSDIEHRMNYINNMISNVETRNKIAGKSFYKALIEQEKKNKSQLKDELSALTGALQEALSSGAIEYGSEEFNNMKKKIYEVEEAIQESKNKIDELKQKIKEVAKLDFDNLKQQFENALGLITGKVDFASSVVDAIEASGHIASVKFYQAMIDGANEQITANKKKLTTLQNRLAKAMSEGDIEKYDDQWYEMNDAIEEVKKSILDAANSVIQFANAMQQVQWDMFDRMQKGFSTLNDEAEYFIKMFSHEDIFDKESGALNDYGLATQALYVQRYQTYKEAAEEYAKEIQKLNERLANDPSNVTLLDRYDELLHSFWDATEAAEEEKDAIKDLISNGFDKLRDSIMDIINRYKEALQAKKDLYDYENTIEEQTSNINSLQKQLLAYSGDDSEETRATIQKLSSDLVKAQKELEETEYDKYISDQEKLLDDFANSLEEWLNERLDDIDKLLSDAIAETNANAATISNTIIEEANANSGVITTEMRGIWNEEQGYMFTTNDILTSTSVTCEDISNKIDLLPTSELMSEYLTDDNAPIVSNLTSISSISSSINSTITEVNSVISRIKSVVEEFTGGYSSVIDNMGANVVKAINAKELSVSVTVNGNEVSTDTSGGSGPGYDPSPTPKPSKNKMTYVITKNGQIYGGRYATQAAAQDAYNKLLQDYIKKHGSSQALLFYQTYKIQTEYYKKGGVISGLKSPLDELAREVGEDHMIAAKEGERVLTEEQNRNFEKLAENGFKPIDEDLQKQFIKLSSTFDSGKIDNFVDKISKVDLPNVDQPVNNNNSIQTNVGDVSINLPNVTNKQEFVSWLKNDGQIEKIIQSMTLSKMIGENSYDKLKY